MTIVNITSRNWMPWLMFCCGLLTVPLVFVVGCVTSHPRANWDTSFFGRRLAWPLFIFGFCCCFVSPFFTRFSTKLRLVLALAGVLMAGIIFFVCEVVLFFLF